MSPLVKLRRTELEAITYSALLGVSWCRSDGLGRPHVGPKRRMVRSVLGNPVVQLPTWWFHGAMGSEPLGPRPGDQKGGRHTHRQPWTTTRWGLGPTSPSAPFKGPLTRWMARPPTAINVNKKMSGRPGIVAQIGHPGFWLKSGTRDFGSNRAPGSAQNKTPP